MKPVRTVESIQQKRAAKGALFAAFSLQAPLASLPFWKRSIHQLQGKPSELGERNLLAACLQSTWVDVVALNGANDCSSNKCALI